MDLVPKAQAAEVKGESASVTIAGMSELVVFSLMVCLVDVVVWKLAKAIGKSCWSYCCKLQRGQKAKKLKAMARVAAEAEVDKAFAS